MLALAALVLAGGLTGCGGGGGAAANLPLPEPEGAVSPAALSFESTAVGHATPAQTVTLSNTGNAPLVCAFSISGTAAADFAESNTCGLSLAAGASCTISVTFTPSAAGSRTATLGVTGADVSGVPLTGTGAAAQADLDSSALTFANTNVGSTTPAQILTLSNPGNEPLAGGIAITGSDAADFAQTNTCGASLAAGASCTISVTFTPGAGGNLQATLNVTASGVTGTAATLSGVGVSGQVTLSATQEDFGSQVQGIASAPQTVTLTNGTSVPLTISSIVVGGTDAGDFAETNTCPAAGATLAAGDACTISTTFTPSAQSQRSATVTITDDAVGGGTQSFRLSGSGTSGIGAIVPALGPTAGGTIVSVEGHGFPTSGPAVQVGTAAATNISVNSAGTLMQFAVPSAVVAAPAPVTVLGAGGTSLFTTTANFQYTNATMGCGFDCGNVAGDDVFEGQPHPANPQPISACGKITTPGNYILTQNVGTDPTNGDCIEIVKGPASLNLGGHTVTGGIQVDWDAGTATAPIFYNLFNGTVTCSVAGGACITWSPFDGWMHYLTVENSAHTNAQGQGGPLANIDIGSYFPLETVSKPMLRIDHVTSTVPAEPNAPRTRNIMSDGSSGNDPDIVSVPLEAFDNLITCSDGASACQGIELFDNPHSYVHNNKFVMPAACENCDDAARAVIFDSGSDYGVAAYNEFDLNGANRGVRVRLSHHIAIYGNTFNNINDNESLGSNGQPNHAWKRYAAVHIGESNEGIDDDFVDVFNNSFQLGPGGNGITVDAASDIFVFDNTVTCVKGDCSGIGYFAKTDISDSGKDLSTGHPIPDQTGTVLNAANNDVSALGGAVAVYACGEAPGSCSGTNTGVTTVNYCNTGTAGGPGEKNEVVLSPTTPCPAPLPPVKPQTVTLPSH